MKTYAVGHDLADLWLIQSGPRREYDAAPEIGCYAEEWRGEGRSVQEAREDLFAHISGSRNGENKRLRHLNTKPSR